MVTLSGVHPVFLYYDPHPVHKRMAEYVSAEFVQCSTGGPVDRIRAGASHEFGDSPVILEGGVPLVEAAALSAFGESGPLVALGADSTYHDLVAPIEGRSRRSRLAHRIGLKTVDATIAVSEHIATLAERFSGGPTRISHPFVTKERFDALRDVEPDLAVDRILCVGKYRIKNGQDRLVKAVKRVDANLTVTFAGPDTDELDGPNVEGLGFVDEDRLVELFASSSLFAFPATVGAFPVATLEALAAGLPTLTNGRVGTGTLVRGVHPRLAVAPEPDEIAEALDWYFDLGLSTRQTLGHRARGYGVGFDEASGLAGFAETFDRLLANLDEK